MAIVRPEDLTRYATSEAAPFALGELVRRLVYTWVNPENIDLISFHSGSANNLPSWDGVLRLKPNSDGGVFSCLWELSSQDADAAKIRRDFAKRLQEPVPDGWSRDHTTLAMVTYRKLQDRFGLQSELRRTKGSRWYDIQIIDAPALSQWISMCPPVEAWCAEELGIGARRFGISLDGFWKHWAMDAEPNITPVLMLAGRQTVLNPASLMPTPGTVLNLLADSPEEAAAYVHALLASEPFKDTRDALLSRSLVINTEAQARAYADESPLPGAVPLTVLLPPATGAARFVANTGHFVVNALGHGTRDVANLVRLGRGLAFDVAGALASTMRVDSHEAMRQARDSGSSVTIWGLLNRMKQSGGLGDRRPGWAERAVVTSVLPAVLTQGWDAAYANDKGVLAALAAKPYADFEASLHRFINCDSPLLQRTHGVVTVVAPAVAFLLSCDALTEQQLGAFKESFEQAMRWVSPSKRDEYAGSMAYRTSDHDSGYSDWLREGLASTLLQISAFKERLKESWPTAVFGSPQAFVDTMVAQTVRLTQEPLYFHALGKVLPLLAEASPAAFIAAVEESLNRPDDDITHLFVPSDMFTPQLYQWLLHSLELVSRAEDSLERASRLLLRLAQCDTRQSNNRVLDKLRYVYQAAFPSSSARIDQRVDVLRHLSTDFSVEIWKLVMKLISSVHGQRVVPPTRWKDLGSSGQAPQTQAEIMADFAKYTGFALELAGTDLNRLRELLSAYQRLTEANRKSLAKALAAAVEALSSNDALRQVWTEAEGIVERHRKHSEQRWALPEASLSPLAELCDALHAKLSPEEAWMWVFKLDRDSYTESLGAMLGHKMTREQLKIRQREAVEDIKTRSGIKGLARLIALTTQPYPTCHALAETLSQECALEVCDIWAKSTNSDDAIGLACLSAMRFSIHGPTWTPAVLHLAESHAWNADAKAMIFLNYIDSCELFEAVATLDKDTQASFWRRRRVSLKSESKKLVTFMAHKLLKAGRALDLIEQQTFACVRTRVLLHIVRAASIELARKGPVGDSTMLDYYFGSALDELKLRAQAKHHLAELEYPLFSLLHTHHPERKFALHEELSGKPETFMLFLRRLYFPKGTTKPDVIDPQMKGLAGRAYDILNSWRTPPGVRDGRANMTELRAWLAAVQDAAEAEGFVEAAQNEIGRMLRHMPPNVSDRQWPSDDLAEVLEELDSDAVIVALGCEVHNAADVRTREVLDGGGGERSESARWLEVRRRLPLKHKRARELCQRLADSFGSFAQLTERHSSLQRIEWQR